MGIFLANNPPASSCIGWEELRERGEGGREGGREGGGRGSELHSIPILEHLELGHAVLISHLNAVGPIAPHCIETLLLFTSSMQNALFYRASSAPLIRQKKKANRTKQTK